MKRDALQRFETALMILRAPSKLRKDVYRTLCDMGVESIQTVAMELSDKEVTVTVQQKECQFKRSYPLP